MPAGKPGGSVETLSGGVDASMSISLTREASCCRVGGLQAYRKGRCPQLIVSLTLGEWTEAAGYTGWSIKYLQKAKKQIKRTFKESRHKKTSYNANFYTSLPRNPLVTDLKAGPNRAPFFVKKTSPVTRFHPHPTVSPDAKVGPYGWYKSCSSGPVV